MFKIGEISKITKVSVQMIRHYQKLNLIKPEYIDPKTGYRFFSEEAIYKIWNIKLMQMAGFSLRDIEINGNLSFKESINKIGEVKNELESKVIEYNKLIKYLDKQMINLNYMRDYSEKRGEIKYFKRRYGKKVDIDYSKKSHYELLELMMKDGIDIEITHQPSILIKLENRKVVKDALFAIGDTNNYSNFILEGYYYCKIVKSEPKEILDFDILLKEIESEGFKLRGHGVIKILVEDQFINQKENNLYEIQLAVESK